MRDFEEALRATEHDMGCRGSGTVGEKTLHLALKYFFAPDPDTHERPLGGFIADAVTEDGVIEVQTRGLSRLKPKLAAFLPLCPVTVVHPVADPKWVCRVDEYGELLSRRRSPKHESIYTALREIYTLREYLMHPNFRICLCTVELAEYSVQTGSRKRQKLDRVPEALHAVRYLERPADYAALLPETLPAHFTVQMLSDTIHAPEMQTRLLISLLLRFGIIEESGKAGRCKQWRRSVSGVIGG